VQLCAKKSLTDIKEVDTLPVRARSAIQEDPSMVGFISWLIIWLGFWEGEF
jgi:hypothetical protein